MGLFDLEDKKQDSFMGLDEFLLDPYGIRKQAEIDSKKALSGDMINAINNKEDEVDYEGIFFWQDFLREYRDIFK